MDKQKPSDFDWVTVRSACSAVKVFEQLRADSERNAKTFNELADRKVEWFGESDYFGICWKGYRGTVGVRFNLYDNEIAVATEGIEPAVSFTATLTLNDQGECRLRVNGVELDRWQVLRRAFEPVMFSAGRR